MKILKQSAELLWITENAEQIIERAGRTCYKSEDRITLDSSGAFIKRILESGHESVIEHASASILFICDRGVSHELVRHRLASYSQESTRYCTYESGITVIEPPGLNVEESRIWIHHCEQAELNYQKLLRLGCAAQIARSVLPTCLKTEIVTTTNLREWRHIFRLRRSSKAHPQIKEIMDSAYLLLNKQCPNVFGDL